MQFETFAERYLAIGEKMKVLAEYPQFMLEPDPHNEGKARQSRFAYDLLRTSGMLATMQLVSDFLELDDGSRSVLNLLFAEGPATRETSRGEE